MLRYVWCDLWRDMWWSAVLRWTDVRTYIYKYMFINIHSRTFSFCNGFCMNIDSYIYNDIHCYIYTCTHVQQQLLKHKYIYLYTYTHALCQTMWRGQHKQYVDKHNDNDKHQHATLVLLMITGSSTQPLSHPSTNTHKHTQSHKHQHQHAHTTPSTQHT